MALPRAEAELLWLRVLGMLRNPASEHDPRTIALAYYRQQLASGPSYSYAEYLSVALQAARSYAAGAAVRADPTVPVVPPRNATDPTAIAGATGYQYRVVVDVYEGGNHIGSTAVNVTSATPLSADDVASLAGEVARGVLPGRDYAARVVEDASPQATLTATVLTAARVL